MIRRVAQFFAAQPFITAPLWLLLLGFGFLSYFSLLPREGFPSAEVPLVIVSGGYFVEDSETVDVDVAVPISEALEALPEVATVSTNARDNSFVAIVNLEADVLNEVGTEKVEEALADIDLPDTAQYQVEGIAPAKFLNRFDLLVGVTGPTDASAEELEAAAGELPELLSAKSEIVSAELVDLFSRGVDPATGEDVITESAFNQASVDVGDTSEIRPALAIGVVGASDADALGLSDAVTSVLDGIEEGQLGENFEPFIAVDFATQIRSQIGSLQRNVLTGLLAVSIIALLMISWRASIVTALFILTVLATSVGVLYLFGISLNTISLFGIILALGLFVDDAIVITEAVDAFRDDDGDPIAGIGNAVKRVGAASVSGTVTTVLVFATMLSISGLLGEFIRVLPISVIIALVTSLVLSIIFIPFASRYLVLPAPRSRGPFGSGSGLGSETRCWSSRLIGQERHCVHRQRGSAERGDDTGRPRRFRSSRRIQHLSPPTSDAIAFETSYQFEPGTSIEEARAISLEAGQQFVDELGPDFVRAFTYQGDARQAFVQYTVSDVGSGREPLPELIEKRLTPIADSVEGARVRVQMLSPGPPEAEFPFQMQVFGEDAETLLAAGATLASELEGATVSRPNGTTFNIVEAQVALGDVVARESGKRLIEVRARFDADDITTTTTQTETYATETFGADELEELGLEADALGLRLRCRNRQPRVV